MIAVLIGHLDCKFKYVSNLEFTNLVIGGIEIGNILYESLNIAAYLTICDIVSLLPEHISVEVSKEANSFPLSKAFNNKILELFTTSASCN